MCPWNDTIKDRISYSGFVEVFIPFGNWELCANDGCAFLVSVFEDLEQDELNLLGNGLDAKIVEDDELCFFEEVEPFDERSIGFGQCNLFAEPVEVKVKGPVAVSASLMPEGTSEEGFSAAGGTGDEDVFGTCQISR